MANGFIIRRNKKSNLHLFPFVNPKQAGQWKEEEQLNLYASTGLATKEKDDALFTVYEQIDKGVDLWIQEARYVPRLLLSAAVFLVVYFFFSLAIRDPVPVIDELLLGLGAAFATGMLLSKSDKKSELAMRRRLALKQNASRCDWQLCESLSVIEDYLDACDGLDTLELANRLALATDKQLIKLKAWEDEPLLQQELLALLLQHFQITDRRFYNRYTTVIASRLGGKPNELLAARLVKWSFKGEIDLSLLSLMVVLTTA